ncbi:hypothetical protein AMATHDRAFT_70757 [Amanita thiersii Skay4041]|uniref:Gti1/Pac2 family protein n=1 Tax=Amanita thiersii Skay4041 TaxID=703135 RepID=A0A2A9NE69_9AGAR|nr:hypothetical protein AMATHDRAFT_70757 [Amanita thiersii Skay4041]
MTSNPDVPPFIGYVETTVNALRLIHAARQGVIPRITRRLNDSERRTMIKSGAVFVFSVEESGIKRWTDGLLWSPSRIVGNFLVYREINERTSSRGGHKKPYPTDESSRALARRNSPDSISGAYKAHLVGTHGGNDQGTFKPGGLIKKTITVTIEGSDLHLISYYTSEDIRSGKLKRPTSRPDIMALPLPPHIFRLTTFRVPPKVEIGPDGKPRLVCEPEDLEPTDCKTEETPYVPDSSHWPATALAQSSTGDNQYGGGTLYPISQSQQGIYNRVNNTDRWTVPSLDGLRLGSLGRTGHDVSWPSSVAHHTAPARRREGSHLSQTADSWPSLHSQSSRWQNETQDQTNSFYVDRNRLRSSSTYESSSLGAAAHQHQHQHQQHQQRRDTDLLATNITGRSYFNNGHVATTGHRDGVLPRLAWLPQDNSSDITRDSRTHSHSHSHSHHSASSFSSSPTIPFSPHHAYQSMPHTTYGSTYESNTMLDNTSTFHPASPQGDLHTYDTTSYASGSATMSSPEEYTKLEEFGDP